MKLSGKQRTGSVLMLSPNDIRTNPDQPRHTFDAAQMKNLADSIRENGIIQPLCVREKGRDEYELISGERRLRAAISLGLSAVPCVLSSAGDRESCLIALIENIQREDLSFFEEAEGIARLIMIYGLSQTEAASRLGMSQSSLANKLRLLRISREQRERIDNMSLTERHARALLRLCTDSQRDEALNRIIAQGLNVDETDRMIDQMLTPAVHRKPPKIVMRDVKLFVNTINRAIDVMKISGINATSEKSETEQYIKYTVTIPKKSG